MNLKEFKETVCKNHIASYLLTVSVKATADEIWWREFGKDTNAPKWMKEMVDEVKMDFWLIRK